MTKPLFQHFDASPQRGRPKSPARAITRVDDDRLDWLGEYPQKLKDLDSDPLAWLFQIKVRSWWVWVWEMALADWLRVPSLFPKFLRASDPTVDVVTERFLQRFGNRRIEDE